MRIIACQWNLVWEDKRANYQKARALLERSSIPPGSLIVLPEMFSTGFSMNVANVREGNPSETEAFLRQLALEYRAFVMGGLVAPGADGRPQNQSLVFSPQGRLEARYAKIHPFTLGGEADHYAAGSELVTFDWQGCRVAPFICYDLRFPEIFRSAVQQGVQLFAVIANWPVKRERHWITLLQARAIENQACVIGVNRCGTDPKFTYSGRTMVVDHHGIIRGQLGDEDLSLSVDIDLEKLNAWRKDFPALQDMRWGKGQA